MGYWNKGTSIRLILSMFTYTIWGRLTIKNFNNPTTLFTLTNIWLPNTGMLGN